MNEMHQRALEYIQNTGGNPKVEWFDTDWEPIGPMLRADMTRDGLIVEENGHLKAVEKS